LGGAVFLSFSDLITRIIFAPISIPIAVITNFVGAVFFIFLLVKKNDRN
jgi:iron complex transport system permease protein